MKPMLSCLETPTLPRPSADRISNMENCQDISYSDVMSLCVINVINVISH